jgi:hypothetical protein
MSGCRQSVRPHQAQEPQAPSFSTQPPAAALRLGPTRPPAENLCHGRAGAANMETDGVGMPYAQG